MLSRLLYYLVLKPLSYLPLKVLYLLSDFLYLLLHKIFRYRQKVVRTNLVNSFPGKSLEEIKKIEREFYSHFCDLIIESIRLFSISEKELRRRSKIVNPEMILDLYKQGRGVIMVAGHYNNWEMAATIMGAQVQHQVIGIYTPMSNKFFDKKFKNSREKFGIEMVSKKIVKDEFEKNKDSPTITLFATDQSPTYSKNVHWTNFLHQPTAVFLGAERFAREYELPVVFGYIKKIRRGYYELNFVMMETHPSETQEGEITEKHTRWLEKQIEEVPQFWLWTHKRWKRKMKEGEALYTPL